jgi:hypothetical protein
MENERQNENTSRLPYEPPTIQRVHLDPVREMLTACPTDQGGKLPGACNNTGS